MNHNNYFFLKNDIMFLEPEAAFTIAFSLADTFFSAGFATGFGVSRISSSDSSSEPFVFERFDVFISAASTVDFRLAAFGLTDSKPR